MGYYTTFRLDMTDTRKKSESNIDSVTNIELYKAQSAKDSVKSPSIHLKHLLNMVKNGNGMSGRRI